MCEGEAEGEGGSCDPTAPRPASQAGETRRPKAKPTWVPPLRATSWCKPARAVLNLDRWNFHEWGVAASRSLIIGLSYIELNF